MRLEMLGGVKNEIVPERMAFPWGEEAIEIYKKEYGNNPDEIETVRKILDIFFNQEVENIALYESKEGATLPYTRISVGDLAKALYEKQTGKKAEIKTEENGTMVESDKRHIRREFVFPGGPLSQIDNGLFHYVEEAIHQCMMHLPVALEDLRNGREPETHEIFTFGTPINEFGTMSPQFFEALKVDPTGTMSKVFAEFIEKNGLVKNNIEDQLNIELYGLSSLSCVFQEETVKGCRKLP